MTAIAWAIITVGLIYYDAIYRNELAAKELSGTIGGLILVSIIILLVCTARELTR